MNIDKTIHALHRFSHEKLLSGVSALAAPVFGIALACGLAGPASAAGFEWRNDPYSTIDPSGATRNCGGGYAPASCGNSITYTGFKVVNGAKAQADIGLFVPFAWPRDATQPTNVLHAIAWDNALKGWFSADFANLGTSLLVTVDITGFGPNSTVLAGDVANYDAKTMFGPTSTDVNNPDPPFPPETLAATDVLPFVDLGSFAVGEEKTYGLVWTYTFGDGRSCDLVTFTCRTGGSGYSLGPGAPEPSTWAMMLSGFGGLGLLALRRRSLASGRAG